MPKMKTNSGAKKRFIKTGSGGFKHKNAFRRHILTSKSAKRKRQLRQDSMVHASDLQRVQRMLAEH